MLRALQKAAATPDIIWKKLMMRYKRNTLRNILPLILTFIILQKAKNFTYYSK